MILENIYINFNEKLNISSISSYRIIMNKFVNKYIKLYSDNYTDTNELYSDALLYSKYYLYYKIFWFYNIIMNDYDNINHGIINGKFLFYDIFCSTFYSTPTECV